MDFTFDLYIFLESFICIWSLFLVFTGSGTHCTYLQLLDHYETLKKALLKT